MSPHVTPTPKEAERKLPTDKPNQRQRYGPTPLMADYDAPIRYRLAIGVWEQGREYLWPVCRVNSVHTRALTRLPKMGGISGYRSAYMALSGFLMMLTQNGKLLYISDNAAEYLGHSMWRLRCITYNNSASSPHKPHSCLQQLMQRVVI
uniref:PAS domain-containing protein n=1 Tax=Anopheles maculatus TaxID=74869 RepID=A0A182SFE4_9DIPT